MWLSGSLWVGEGLAKERTRERKTTGRLRHTLMVMPYTDYRDIEMVAVMRLSTKIKT